MTIKINEAMAAYIAMRDSIAVKNREAKDYAASLKDNMDKLELYIHKLLVQLGTDSFAAKGVGTAFIASKDSVTISDKEHFKRFLARKFLISLQSYHYKTQDGEWQPDGEVDLEEHVNKILDSGTFDLLTISANKLNCKSYMADNEGILPDGVDYFKENVVQFRKGK